MAMIFPGMDPYLEKPEVFPGIHYPMVVYLADRMTPLLRPRYIASIGVRVYYEEPMLEFHEPYIEILDRQSALRIVTVIELVSPSNKYAGPGHDAYAVRQGEVLNSEAHLVEIDLLRHGLHVLAVPEPRVADHVKYDYLITVNRAGCPRNRFEIWPWAAREPLPVIALPLAGDDPDIPLDIRPALERAYEAGSYRDRINYHAPCEPPLQDDDQTWADELIRASEPTP